MNSPSAICPLVSCGSWKGEYALEMPTLPASRAAKKCSGRGLPRAEIQRRLEEIELASVSAVRALEMEVDADRGVPSAAVLRKARLAIR